MKRDMDLIRDMLLRFEAADTDKTLLAELRDLASKDVLLGHVELLKDAGLLDAIYMYKDMDHTAYDDEFRITSAGHDFLDTIRDPAIWQKTKVGANQLGGWSVKLLADLAAGFVRAKAQELGLPLG